MPRPARTPTHLSWLRSRATAACAAVLLAALPAGCASWGAHGVTPTPERTYRIAVAPVAVTARARHLADLETVTPPAPEGVEEQARIAAALDAAGARLTRSLRERLAGAGAITLAEPDAADAVLHVTLSGYGRIKGRWLAYLIGTGVAEGVAQGVITWHVLGNAWVALAVGLEEIASEVLTWGGGAWLVGAWYSPVTLEARLVATADGRTVWRGLAFAGIDRKALKARPPEERERREVQLAVTVARAEAELVRELQKAARFHLNPPRARRDTRWLPAPAPGS